MLMGFKDIIFFVGGCAIGAATTYFCMRDHCDKLIEDETYNIKKYYENKYENTTEKIENIPDTSSDICERMKDEKVQEEKEEPNYEEIIQKLNYNEFSTTIPESNQKAKRPYIINVEEYSENNGYVKKIISFFEDDEVCMDNETKEILDNVAKDIGTDCMEQLNEDGNEIYVRNDQLGIDFNIVSEPGSYEDFIDE